MSCHNTLSLFYLPQEAATWHGNMLLHRSMPSASVGEIFPTDADRTKVPGGKPPAAARGRDPTPLRWSPKASYQCPEE
ncbi:MAG: hypothetical protein LBQ54_01715 [Planctomycetaceae bacterium]|nr:hypothetical protein [Planctomycetaceae bacterium]